MDVRNFSIIAHIDHGKSTLAAQLLRLSQNVPTRQPAAGQFDTMPLEQERGVTIKLRPVTFLYNGIRLNLIDTPGHVDFSYEVSRALAAVEGTLLVVDATQGLQAQTFAHYGVAHDLGLAVIPVVNKIDLPNADADAVCREVAELIGCDVAHVLRVSAKTGDGVRELLTAIMQRIPEPRPSLQQEPRALIFDAVYDEYRGVLLYLRMIDGELPVKTRIQFCATRREANLLDVGAFQSGLTSAPILSAGDIGFAVTDLKSLEDCHVGDTVTNAQAKVEALPGYQSPQSMVFASLYPQDGDDVADLRKALEKLRLNDAALQFEGERSGALGLGFRCGFLGLFHLEITQERLRREYEQEPIVTVPSVAYRIVRNNGVSEVIRTAADYPDPTHITRIEEPWVALRCVVPPNSLGAVMQLIAERRGAITETETIASGGSMERVLLHANMPLAEVLTDFFDTLKSRTSGYASMYYTFKDFRPADVVKLTILVAGDVAESLSTLIIREQAQTAGRRILAALKDHLPREQFEIRLQAAVGGTIIAAERIPALRKDVTAKLYGGDVTRKRKLLEKQKKGKKKMRTRGRVSLPTSAYLAVVRRRSE